MVDPNLTNSIKTSLTQGKTKEAIYTELLSKGATIDTIQQSFNAILDISEKEDTQKRTIRIIVTIGTILIGAGIFSFIAANWQEMTKFTKVAIIIVSMLTAYSLGWFFKEKQNLKKTGEALILLGAIIYGSGIFLIGQIFHIRANWPDGFILWMIGSLILAMGIESYPVFTLSIILGIIAILGYPAGFIGSFSANSDFLTPSYLLLAATVTVFTLAILIRRKISPDQKNFY